MPSLTASAVGSPRLGLHDSLAAGDAIALAKERWAQALPARIFAPDPRVARAWEQNAWHILAAMEGGLPRIGVAHYPIFWQRDGILILRALDLMGRQDLARRGCEWLAPHPFGGGFGAEADAPGEGIWALVRHALFTGDEAWLARHFPWIELRVQWIERMLRADRPLRCYTDNRMPDTQDTPGGSIVCIAATNGLVKGRMDGHHPDFYINCWCWAGLHWASQAAARLSLPQAEAWAAAAAALSERIESVLLPAYGNERDPAVAPWPTGWTPREVQPLRQAFVHRWQEHRVDAAGQRAPEPHWTYFEAATAHNALLLGEKERAWTTLAGLLDPPERWDVADIHEGPANPDDLMPFGNGRRRRGWLQPGRMRAGNMPHNWTTAELLAALRSIFIRETPEGLLVGEGVPASWLRPGARFGVQHLPTELGLVTFTATVQADGSVGVDWDGPARRRYAWAS